MNQLVISLLTAIIFFNPIQHNWHMDRVWFTCTDEQRMELPSEYLANAIGMDENEFEYMARVVEAESNRDGAIDDKILIAAVIFNRSASSYFTNGIANVLNESGQFDTTYNGYCSIPSTKESRWAIVEAYRELYSEEIPTNLLFFNSIGYNGYTEYCYCNGTYFMTYGG